MKINLVSDLHLEFHYQELPGGEVLILAGDVAEARSIEKHHHSTKLVDDKPINAYRCSEFFKYECAKYEKVFYVMGNHEHYHGYLNKTYDTLKRIIPSNVTLLDCMAEEYNGVLFVGGTMWTDLNRGDPLTEFHLKQCMNDFRVITNKYSENHYGKLQPFYTGKLFTKTLNYFKTVLKENKEKPVVMITHHAPSFQSVNVKYKTDTLMNGGYCSELSDFILDHDNIKFWCHGHMHDPVDYMIGDCRVLANPRGYPNEFNNGFDRYFTFEI